MRGFLASMVVAFHVYKFGSKAGFYPATDNSIVQAFGPYIVCIFFCISGYLILLTLLNKDDVWAFARNRFERIYPLFLILHLIMFSIGPWRNYEWMGALRGHPGAYAEHFLSNALFLPGIFQLPLAQKNAWSLSYEALFYILAALFYVGIRRNLRYVWTTRLLLGTATLFLLIWRSNFWYFLVGVVTFWLLSKKDQALVHPAGNWLPAACFALGVISFPYVLPIAVAATFVFFYCSVAGVGFLPKWFATRPLLWLGKISYSLYLVHPFVMDPIRSVLTKLSPRIGAPLAGVLFLVLAPPAAIGVSALSYRFIEHRLTRRLFRPGG